MDQLIAISARPRDLIISRTQLLQQEQLAVTELTALTIGLQLATDKLAESDTFTKKNVTSSDASVLSASTTGTPSAGTFKYTTVRQALNHQLLSSGVSSLESEIGVGTLSFRFGGFVDRGVDLNLLNQGGGIQRGKIRITDRSGTSATVDLRFVKTVEDVLQTINSVDEIDIEAVTDGDSIRLIDQTGQTLSNLRVQEVGIGTTAADLGLGGIDVAQNEAVGSDVLQLYNGLNLIQLNDGNGVSFRAETADLDITFQDTTSLQVDFFANGNEEQTLSDLLATLNAADPARLSAQINAAGDGIDLTDLTTGSGTFSVASTSGGTVAEDLGLTGAATGGVVSGDRILSGLKTTLISSLAGGYGLATLGQIDLTDRSGASDSVDLSTAESLEDVLKSINSANVGIVATINKARNGILLSDNTGQSGNLVVANGDATNSADTLGITLNAALDQVDGGGLGRQSFHEQLTLDSLNGGNGVQLGSFLVSDTDGNTGAVNLTVAGATTVGDVLDEINSLGIGVLARINDDGDGIYLVDTAGGTGKITVNDSGNGTAAADLKIAGTSELIDINGTPTEVINGSTTFSVDVESGDTLQDVIDKITAETTDVAASILNDGSPTAPYRLSLVSQVSGLEGELQVDATQFSLSFQEIVRAQDALLLVGDAESVGAGILTASSSNTFENVLEGVSLSILSIDSQPVTISIEQTSELIVSNINLFVDQYNKIRDKLEEHTFFNQNDNTTGVLFGSHVALRLDTSLPSLLSGRFFGAGEFRSLEAVGVQLKSDGNLEFDQTKFQAAYDDDAAAIEQLFTTEDLGVAAKLDTLIETLAGENDSLLVTRVGTLQSQIDFNGTRVVFLNERLEAKREELLEQFIRLEETIARLQTNLQAIASIQALPSLLGSN